MISILLQYWLPCSPDTTVSTFCFNDTSSLLERRLHYLQCFKPLVFDKLTPVRQPPKHHHKLSSTRLKLCGPPIELALSWLGNAPTVLNHHRSFTPRL